MAKLKFVVIGEDLEQVFHSYGSYANHHTLVRGMVFKADNYFGKGKWKPKKDPNLAGFRAVGESGEVLTLEIVE